jgi:hypothetical protein
MPMRLGATGAQQNQNGPSLAAASHFFLVSSLFVEKTAGDAEKSREYCEKIARTAKSEDDLPVWCFQDTALVRTVTKKRLESQAATPSTKEPFVGQGA